MATIEDASPLDAAPAAVTLETGEAPAEAPAAVTAQADAAAAPDPHETLSPAVRRLVRQFDLDIAAIHGTGPSGRIRVSDVMALLNGRTDSGNRDAPVRIAVPENETEPGDEAEAPAAAITPRAATDVPAHVSIPTTTVFDCDLSRVLSHRKKLRRDNVELLTTSYFLTALAAAVETAPELTADAESRFGVSLTTTDGELRSALLAVPSLLPESLDDRVRAVDAALRANLDADLATANLLVHHYGESGSLLATPTPIGAGHAASVGIGRVRREIVVRTIDGVETPRIVARCFVSLSIFTDRISLHRANRALAAAVRTLETWPE